MRNADRIAIRITADEYAIGDTEALEHIVAIMRRGDDDALDQIGGILAESGRDTSAVMDDMPTGFDPDSGEPIDDYEDAPDGLGEDMYEEEDVSLIDACLDDILKPRSRSA